MSKKTQSKPAAATEANPVEPKKAKKPETKEKYRVVHGTLATGGARLTYGDEVELTESEAAHLNKGTSRDDRPTVLLAEDFEQLEQKKDIEKGLAAKRVKSKKRAAEDDADEEPGPVPG